MKYTLPKDRDWHKWFAWYPVRMYNGGIGTFVWLDIIERKWTRGTYYPECSWWDYRLIEEKGPRYG